MDLRKAIQTKNSYLCIGLDPELSLFPPHLLHLPDPVFEFNKAIIAATSDLAVAYKPNLAFYEALGPAGWISLQKTLDLIPADSMKIADAKRGDIGNTSRKYATAFFEVLNFDAITVAPYMGEDSISPFFDFENKWVFVLALTSNAGASDFQFHGGEKDPLYQEVIKRCIRWANQKPAKLGFVAGATRPEFLSEVRDLAPGHCLLVPGVGAQGGNVKDVCRAAKNDWGGLLINSSRGILYAGNGEDFAEKARDEAKRLVEEMRRDSIPGSSD